MRLFIGEFITGGGLLGKELPNNLIREGNMMLEAILKDLIDTGIHEIITTRDTRLDLLPLPIEQISIDKDIYSTWQSCMNDADAVLIIAPESGNVLLNLTYMAEQTNCYVLGSPSQSVRVTSSKLATAILLHKNKIPCIKTIALSEKSIPESQDGWVIKPDDGVGAEDCYYCFDIKEINALRGSIDTDNFVIQAYVPGIPASLSMLCYLGEAQLLACNEQIFSFDCATHKGTLKGLIVNGLTVEWQRFNALAQNIAKADKNLWGYIGVDVIVTKTGLVVVEINPRLTTSYVGLRSSLALNPAELIISIWQNSIIPDVHKKNFLPVNVLLEETNDV